MTNIFFSFLKVNISLRARFVQKVESFQMLKKVIKFNNTIDIIYSLTKISKKNIICVDRIDVLFFFHSIIKMFLLNVFFPFCTLNFLLIQTNLEKCMFFIALFRT